LIKLYFETMFLVIIFLILLGLGLLFAELFIVPGVTVLGIAGLVFLSIGVWYVYEDYGMTAGNITLLFTVIISVVVLVRSFKSRFWEKFELRDSLEGKANEQDAVGEEPVVAGDRGICLSALRPIGIVRFGERVREVEMMNGFAPAGQQVMVVRREGVKIYVKPI
jgi:membrane-bound ClpP family serine protease